MCKLDQESDGLEFGRLRAHFSSLDDSHGANWYLTLSSVRYKMHGIGSSRTARQILMTTDISTVSRASNEDSVYLYEDPSSFNETACRKGFDAASSASAPTNTSSPPGEAALAETAHARRNPTSLSRSPLHQLAGRHRELSSIKKTSPEFNAVIVGMRLIPSLPHASTVQNFKLIRVRHPPILHHPEQARARSQGKPMTSSCSSSTTNYFSSVAANAPLLL